MQGATTHRELTNSCNGYKNPAASGPIHRDVVVRAEIMNQKKNREL